MNIVSWQSVLTEHQAYLMQSLQDEIGGNLLIVTGSDESEQRRSQGWTSPRPLGLQIVSLKDKKWWQQAGQLMQEHESAFHLFGGMFADRRFLPLLLRAQYQGLRTALMMEPYAASNLSYFEQRASFPSRCRGWLRPLVYRVAALLVARRLTAFFPISNLAMQQYQDAGFTYCPAYPFGYFVPRQDFSEDSSLNAAHLRLAFIGSLIERKGLHVLLQTMMEINQIPTCLEIDIFGPGEPPQMLPPHVHFKGRIPFGQVQAVVRQYDALILPSLHDGWGVVVNEALLQGVPALVSDATGAKVLVQASGAGSVFPSGDPVGLLHCLQALQAQPGIVKSWKQRAKEFAPLLEPQVAACYLRDSLLHASGALAHLPSPPWYPTSTVKSMYCSMQDGI